MTPNKKRTEAGYYMPAIQLALSRQGVTIFRQNVGQAWAGEPVRVPVGGVVRLEAGDVVIRKARPLQAGLCKGSSDLIGWRSVTITPDMVGRQIAQFVACEVKAPGGRPTPEQVKFIERVNLAGGLGTFAVEPTDLDGLF